MNILFFCHGFARSTIRLMPWRYLWEVGKGLVRFGHKVSILSVGTSDSPGHAVVDGMDVQETTLKGVFANPVNRNLIDAADHIVWSSSPLTFAFGQRLESLNRPVWLLYTGPYYLLREVVNAQWHGVPFTQLMSHYKNAMVPISWSRGLVRSPFVKGAIVLSENNSAIMKRAGVAEDKILTIPPGREAVEMDKRETGTTDQIRKRLSLPVDKRIFTYFGSLHAVRGIDILLEAFRRVHRSSENLHLIILARTESRHELYKTGKKIDALGIGGRVSVVPGILEAGQVREYLLASDVVVLPFLLVPSDMPLGALEAMALGKPVISTEVDGMPEMLEGRGVVVRAGDVQGLSSTMSRLVASEGHLGTLRRNCLEYMSGFPTWEETACRFQSLIVDGAGH